MVGGADGEPRRGGDPGQGLARVTLHAAWRALILVFLGVFLRSVDRRFTQTNFTFEDTLSQIGLGYVPLFLLGLAPRAYRWIALGVILIGYWGAFALYPLPGPGFNYAAAGASWVTLAPNWARPTSPRIAAGMSAQDERPRSVLASHRNPAAVPNVDSALWAPPWKTSPTKLPAPEPTSTAPMTMSG